MTKFDGYVLCFHHDVLRSSFAGCFYILCGDRGSFMTVKFLPVCDYKHSTSKYDLNTS